MTARASDAVLDRLRGLHPGHMDLALHRVRRLLDALGNPERALPPAVHVAGTNGKGSTIAMIRAGMEAAGRRVHAYTSPHLVRFHERIRLAGELIGEDELTRVLEECERANRGGEITWFEITTCAALLAFARRPADHALLEVGLGGRLDATNVADPELCVIAPVSLDHQAHLGDTLGEIAFEKAGILKPGIPCVVGRQEEEALDAIERQAARVGAPLLAHGQHWHAWEERGRLVYQDETGLLDLPPPALAGPHQVGNAGMAVAALRALGFGEGACEGATRDAAWPARMQRLSRGPLVEALPGGELVLDGGHNPAAGECCAATLRAMPPRPLHLLIGMLNTKDAAGYLRPLAPLADGLRAVSIPGQAATLPAGETVAAAASVGIPAREARDAADAVRAIAAEAPNARVLVGGSLYLAGAVLAEHG